MRRLYARFLVAGLLTFAWNGAVCAQPQTVELMGINAGGAVEVYTGGVLYRGVSASELVLDIEGRGVTGYCADLFTIIALNEPFEAHVLPFLDESIWRQMHYILCNYTAVDDDWAATIQVAIWKLIYGRDYLTVTPEEIENLANALLDEAAGTNLLSASGDVDMRIDCSWTTAGLIDVRATILEHGSPVVGQPVTLSTSAGTFVSPPGNEGLTDTSGTLQATIDPSSATLPVEITLETVGRTVHLIDPLPDVQLLVTPTYGEPRLYTTTTLFDAQPLGDPRTIGFWKHQVGVALTSQGHPQVSSETLSSFLPLEAFGLEVDSLEALHDALWLGEEATMEDRARQQCLATLLNVELGELGLNTLVDIDGDGVADMFLIDALRMAQEAFDSGDFELAKTICDNINNMDGPSLTGTPDYTPPPTDSSPTLPLASVDPPTLVLPVPPAAASHWEIFE